ncbi:hypothetical protein Pcinc_036904 [Petrolisthes cinctipes]|uniref:Uncharacterized protein n=1 Tax=Petrolisthes cinctipes TaxID=88211 RepID=A0AAE1EN71_PETCI|nr:hypothetical protein Pcinc_036904 [Petrolisthes cinctipes]
MSGMRWVDGELGVEEGESSGWVEGEWHEVDGELGVEEGESSGWVEGEWHEVDGGRVVASSVGHNTFIILYSHLDNTDGGEKSIYQYCKENTKLSVYSELREEGYPKELFTVSPKNVQHFELKVTRKLIEKLVADKMCGSLTDVLRIMKEFVNLRNDLCHLALQSLTVKEYKMKLQGMWENFHVMYRSACVLTKTEFPPHVTKELDTILSSLLKSLFKTKDGSKWKIDTKVKDNIKEDSHTRDTSQSSDDSGCYESAKSTNNNKWSSRENPAIEKLTRSQTKKSTTLNVKEKSVQTKAESKRTSKNVSTQVEGLNEAKETEGRTENNNNNSNTTVPASNKNKWTQVNLLEEVETLVACAAVQNGNPQQDNLINRSLCWPSTSAAATQRSSDVCLDSGVEELPSWVHSNERPDGDDSNIDDDDEEGYLREQQIPFYQHDTNSKKEKGEKSTRFASKIHSNGRPDGDDSNNDDDDGDEEYLRGQQIPFCRYDTNSKKEKKKKKEKKEETEEKSSTSFNTSTNNEVNKRTSCQLVCGQRNKSLLQAWNINRHDTLHMRLVVPGKVNALAVSPRAPYYCVVGNQTFLPAISEKIYVYKMTCGGVGDCHYQTDTHLAFTPCGKYFASGGDDRYTASSPLTAFATNTLESQVLLGSSSGRVSVVSLLPTPGDVLVGDAGSSCHEKAVTHMAVTASCNRVVTGSDDGEVKVWTVTSTSLGTNDTTTTTPHLAIQRTIHTARGTITNLCVLRMEREVVDDVDLDIHEIIRPLSQDHTNSPLNASITVHTKPRISSALNITQYTRWVQ